MNPLGLALQMYAQESDGRLPNGWADLAWAEQITPAIFVCPSADDTRPDTGDFKQDVASLDDPAGGHCSYIYTGAGLSLKDGQNRFVLAFEPLTNHGGRGMNVLFSDDQTEWLDAKTNAKAIQHLVADFHSHVRPIVLRRPDPR